MLNNTQLNKLDGITKLYIDDRLLSSNTILNIITGEVPSGLINGTNATFTSAFPFIPSSLQVYVNGLRQKIVTDYQILNSTTIQLLVSLTTNEILLINYQK